VGLKQEKGPGGVAARLPCAFCGGNGRCFKCDGSGVRQVKGRLKRKYVVTCNVCEGSGHCELCRGEGHIARG
jgi:hypothetical protein